MGPTIWSGTASPNIMQALGADEKIADRRKVLYLNAQFFLDGSLLIRSGSGPDVELAAENAGKDALPDTMHLHSARLQSSDGMREPMPICIGHQPRWRTKSQSLQDRPIGRAAHQGR